MNLKKLFSHLLTGVILSTSLLFSSCKDDDKTDPLVGVYAFTSAEALASITAVISDPSVASTLPAGSDVTALILGGLYVSSPCANITNARTELRADNTLWNVCAGGDTSEEQQGSWEVNTERTQLTLTVTVGTQSVPVILTNLQDNGVTLSGDISNFPFALDLTRLTELGAPLTDGPFAGQPNVQFIQVSVVFTRTSF